MADKEKEVAIHLQGTASTSTVAAATLLTTSNLAAQLLEAAVASARNAHGIETRGDPQVANRATVSGSIQQSMVAIVMASTALEACANEIITVILDRAQGITPELRKDLETLRTSKEGNVLDRMNEMAKKLNANINKGASPYQDVGTLLCLRNELVHFKPASSNEKAVHEGAMAKRMEHAVGRSRFYKDEANFPIGYLHYGAAKWAIKTVRTASAHFSQAIGEKDRFASEGFDFSLP